MKGKQVLTPLAFGLALAFAGSVHAVGSGASAVIEDTQYNQYNGVLNQGTENSGTVDNSLNGASGNVGANVAAGDNNQQANAAAVSTADAYFVFGVPVVSSAVASIAVEQKGYNNLVVNHSASNTASMNNSGNDASGNLGINVAAGTNNQQKNDMAIASSSSAHTAAAGVSVFQESYGNSTQNLATLEYGSQQVVLGFAATGTYQGQSDQIGDLYPDMWAGAPHPAGQSTGHFDLDSEAQGAVDLNGDGGALAFNEAGDILLSGEVTGMIPTLVGFASPVMNTASLTGSLNRVSGNVGVNIAAGGGNQQSNSLAVTAGCTACP